MDMEQEELQFLGFFDVCKEAINITFRRSKFFAKLTLTLILPLSIIFLAHDGFSTFLSQKIKKNEDTLDTTLVGSPAFEKKYNQISSELSTLWLIKLVYLTFSLVFSLLSTAAVVYTVACIYTGKDVTYKKVMSVVPKVWKRLMVTFLWNFGIMFAYNFVFVLLIIILTLLFVDQYRNISVPGLLFMIVSLIVYMIGFVYMSVIWQMASVISVMEDKYGLKAMVKSKSLIKGKLGIAVAIFLVFLLCSVGIEMIFEKAEVTNWNSNGIEWKIGYGVVCLVLLTLLFLFGLVVQTIIYFVCKSYHHESIDKSSLANHLEAYLGEYVPLTSNNIQMEDFQHV